MISVRPSAISVLKGDGDAKLSLGSRRDSSYYHHRRLSVCEARLHGFFGRPKALLAMAAVDASTDRHAGDHKNPLQPTDENVVAGTVLYRNHCAGCHGTPSNPDSQFGHSFNPPVPQFFKEGSDMADNQSFYIIQHGIRWSGMPAWNKTLNENQTWEIVTFLSHLEKLPPAAQKELAPAESPAPASTTR